MTGRDSHIQLLLFQLNIPHSYNASSLAQRMLATDGTVIMTDGIIIIIIRLKFCCQNDDNINNQITKRYIDRNTN